jgi:nucleotide-binding universal stress UspA family protein
MFKKIIVPLDGSPLSEEALPYATGLTNKLNATLVLLRVQEGRPLVVEFSQSPKIDAGNLIHSGNIQPDRAGLGGTGSVPAYSTDQYETVITYSGEQDDEDYLQKIKGKLVGLEANHPLKTEQIQTRVICGRSPKDLAAIVKEEQADLVVMTTHGRSGLSLMLTGSIATKLIQHTSLPVIVIKPEETTDQAQEQSEKGAVDFPLDPILVTLDGSPVSETILEAAADLALGLGVKIHLFEEVSSVIPGGVGGVGGIGGFYYLPEYDLEKEVAILNDQTSQYLKEIQTRLREKGVECVTEVQTGEPRATFEHNGEPVARIIAYASQIKAQLVAMTTHGRGQLGQLVLGSVAEEVVRQSHLPVMLMRKAVHSSHIVEN